MDREQVQMKKCALKPQKATSVKYLVKWKAAEIFIIRYFNPILQFTKSCCRAVLDERHFCTNICFLVREDEI